MASTPSPTRPTTPDPNDLVERLAQEADRMGPPGQGIRYERRAYEAHVADRLSGATPPSSQAGEGEEARMRALAAAFARGEARRAERRHAWPTAPMAVLLCILLLVIALVVASTE